MTEQLKPCPFCGSNKNVSLKCQTTFTKGSLFWVECECGVGCGAECGEFNNPIDAILSWGLKEMEQLQARIKELVKLVKVLLENADEQVIDECVSVHIDDISALNSFLNEFRDDNENN